MEKVTSSSLRDKNKTAEETAKTGKCEEYMRGSKSQEEYVKPKFKKKVWTIWTMQVEGGFCSGLRQDLVRTKIWTMGGSPG